MVRPVRRSSPSSRAKLDSFGQFYFPSLEPNVYSLAVDNIPGWFLQEVRVGADISPDNLVDLRYQSQEQVTIHLTDRPSSIDVTVLGNNNAFDPNASVFVFPSTSLSSLGKFAVLRGAMVPRARNGHFLATAMQPGSYLVVAVTDDRLDIDWREPEILRRLAAQASQIKVDQGHVANVTVTTKSFLP